MSNADEMQSSLQSAFGFLVKLSMKHSNIETTHTKANGPPSSLGMVFSPSEQDLLQSSQALTVKELSVDDDKPADLHDAQENADVAKSDENVISDGGPVADISVDNVEEMTGRARSTSMRSIQSQQCVYHIVCYVFCRPVEICIMLIRDNLAK